MATTDVEICNLALDGLGQPIITSLSGTDAISKWCNRNYAQVRDAELSKYLWNFAITRKSIDVDGTSPAYGYSNRYPVPSDYLRLVSIGEYDAIVDYHIESGFILCQEGTPLKLRYIAQVTDVTKFHPLFVDVVACQLKVRGTMKWRQSRGVKEEAQNSYREAVNAAYQVDAIDNPPDFFEEESWATVRG